jgi:hypothetical protein
MALCLTSFVSNLIGKSFVWGAFFCGFGGKCMPSNSSQRWADEIRPWGPSHSSAHAESTSYCTPNGRQS